MFISYCLCAEGVLLVFIGLNASKYTVASMYCITVDHDCLFISVFNLKGNLRTKPTSTSIHFFMFIWCNGFNFFYSYRYEDLKIPEQVAFFLSVGGFCGGATDEQNLLPHSTTTPSLAQQQKLFQNISKRSSIPYSSLIMNSSISSSSCSDLDLTYDTDSLLDFDFDFSELSEDDSTLSVPES